MTLRQFIQVKLNELKLDETYPIEVGTELPDDMLEEGKIYFSYLLNNAYIDGDFEKNATYDVSLIGYLKVKTSIDVDSLKVIDNAQTLLKNKLKQINFRVSYNDVSIMDNIRKIQVVAHAKYNEINNGII